jgi:hypothetical protein
MLWTWLNIEIYWIQKAFVQERIFRFKKGLRNSHITNTNSKTEKIDQKGQKYYEFFSKNLKKLLRFVKLLFYCWTNVAPIPFFQRSSCTRKSKISDFPDFHKSLFWPFCGSFHFSCDVFLIRLALLPFYKPCIEPEQPKQDI